MASNRRRKKTARKKVEPEKPSTAIDFVGSDRRARLGTKWACFACGAKFYDMNKPEPRCPKCAVDQRTRPPDAPPPPPPPKPPRAPSIPPLLEEEEEAEAPFSDDAGFEELDLGGIETAEEDDAFLDEESPEEGAEEEEP
jgi:hypothetical protein